MSRFLEYPKGHEKGPCRCGVDRAEQTDLLVKDLPAFYQGLAECRHGRLRREMVNGHFTLANATVRNGLLIANLGVHAYAVYSVLLSYSQGPGTKCFPSHATIAELTGISTKQSQRSVKKLEEFGLIKIDSRCGSQRKTHNIYTMLDGDSQSPSGRDSQSLLGEPIGTDSPLDRDSQSPAIGTDSPPKNTKGRIPRKNTSCQRTKTFSDDDMATASYIFSLIKSMKPNFKEPNLDGWANDIRLMRERDSRTDAQIRGLFAWANADPFWQTNILSPGKLRTQWDQLELKSKSKSTKQGKATPRVHRAPPPISLKSSPRRR